MVGWPGRIYTVSAEKYTEVKDNLESILGEMASADTSTPEGARELLSALSSIALVEIQSEINKCVDIGRQLFESEEDESKRDAIAEVAASMMRLALTISTKTAQANKTLSDCVEFLMAGKSRGLAN